MDIKIKHPKSKCWACKYQRKLNKACKGLPFGIEYDFYKNPGEILPHETHMGTYTLEDGRILNFYLSTPFEAVRYEPNSAINIFQAPLSDKSINMMIEDAKNIIENFIKTHKDEKAAAELIYSITQKK